MAPRVQHQGEIDDLVAMFRARFHYNGVELLWIRRHGRPAGIPAGYMRKADNQLVVKCDKHIYPVVTVIYVLVTGKFHGGRVTFEDGNPQNLDWRNLCWPRQARAVDARHEAVSALIEAAAALQATARILISTFGDASHTRDMFSGSRGC